MRSLSCVGDDSAGVCVALSEWQPARASLAAILPEVAGGGGMMRGPGVAKWLWRWELATARVLARQLLPPCSTAPVVRRFGSPVFGDGGSEQGRASVEDDPGFGSVGVAL